MPELPELHELAKAARAAARAARDLLRTARPQHIKAKGNPRDLVTEWDVRSEELIRNVLAEHAPGIPVLGEEGGQGQGQVDGGYRWLVDPIDGTVNFAHGLPLWCVSIALERAGKAVVGVVVAPVLDWWFEATLGGGAIDGHGAPLRVSAIDQLEHALLATGFPYDRATNRDNNFDRFLHMKRVTTVRRLGAAALDLCLVAQGGLDGYWEHRLSAWDLAAGALIVAEAGGTVTNTHGGPFDHHSGEAIASNGAIHDRLVAELGQVPR